jgi:hypothetical protein
VKKIACFVLTSASVFFVYSIAISRDINLDAIYLKETSPYYNRLLESKLTAYETVNSQFIARHVIFAMWQNGYNIIYIKEFPDINILYSYNRITRAHTELCRMQGTIVAAASLVNGSYVYLKRLRVAEGQMVKGETIAVDLKTKRTRMLEPSYPFIDFSLSPDGRGILYETNSGIVEYCTETKVKSLIMRRSVYADIVKSGSPTIARLSPNRKKIVLVNGSGGTYRAKIFAYGRPLRLMGISSSSELYWINNNQLVYRKGFAGSYSVHVYDASAHGSRVLEADSLNTNIRFSNLAKMVSFLHDQLIRIYDIRHNQIIKTGLEGEDVLFSPDGSRFISLFLKRLFITNVYFVKRKYTEIADVSKQIISLYKNFLDSKNDWTNDFSPEYVKRKISVYNKILN